jgi:hypothetical protein
MGKVRLRAFVIPCPEWEASKKLSSGLVADLVSHSVAMEKSASNESP